MADTINLQISVGNRVSYMRRCPAAIESSTPYISWTVPTEINQKRFNIKIKALDPGKRGLFILGEQISSDTIYQYPAGNPLTNQFIGLLSIEVAISENPSSGQPFEYSSGLEYFVYDPRTEQFYNVSNVTLQWGNSIDPNPGQDILYNILVSKDPTFTNSYLEILNTYISANTGSATTSISLDVPDSGDYFWKVRGYDGLDHGQFSSVNGFVNSLNALPKITITSVIVTGNKYGDVIIDFSLADMDSESCYIEAVYTGGSVKDTETVMSLINPLGRVTNGNHTTVWRSGRNEKLIKASDYMVYLIPYDNIGVGEKDFYGFFEMDNSHIGQDAGGVGSSDIDFPVIGRVVKIVHSNNTPLISPVSGRLGNTIPSILLKKQIAVKSNLCSWKTYANGSITDIQNINYNLVPARGYPYGYHYSDINFAAFPLGFSGQQFNKTGYGIGLSSIGDAAINTPENNPPFILTTDYVDSNGIYPEIDERTFGRDRQRKGLILFYKIYLMDKEFCPDCHGKGWQVSELIDIGDGKFQRTKCSTCNGSRFSSVKLNRLESYLVADYKPIEDYISPSDLNSTHCFGGVLPSIQPYNTFKAGYPDTPFDENEKIMQINCPSMNNLSYNIKGTYEAFNFLSAMGVKHDEDFVPGQIFATQTNIPYNTTAFYFINPLSGGLGVNKQDYVTGYSPGEAPGFVNRDTPTNIWERGIFCFSGHIGETQPFEPLKIIYLQSNWDIYNTIHWQATMSSVTRIHLQVCKYFEDGSHTDYTDVIGKDSEYVSEAGAYMTKPSIWHIYWDVVRQQFLDEGYDYRLRIRQFDIVSNTASAWVYGSKFKIIRNLSNPPNILSTEYEKWTKTLKVNFRIDDSRGYAYDITRVWYSVDGNIFHLIGNGDIHGEKYGLSSNIIEDETTSKPMNVHSIFWDTGSYKLDPGNKYRIRIEVIPTPVSGNISSPLFKWSKVPNPRLEKAERRIIELNGQSQSYLYNIDTGELEELDSPLVVPGEIDLSKHELDIMRHSPSPSGMYQFFGPSGLIDPSGYNNWLNYEFMPGVSRGYILSQKEEEYNELVNIELPDAMSERDEAEKNIRKMLIDQGFYNNGFEENDPDNKVFRFRVETMAHGNEILDSNDDYVTVYSTRYESYEVIELDFLESFDSQNGIPLRSFMFNEDGSRIKGTTTSRRNLSLVDGSVNLDKQPIDNKWGDYDKDPSQPWYGKTNADSGLSLNKTDRYKDTKFRLFGKYLISKSDLPGERKDYFIDNSYPSVTDFLPDGFSSFDTDYYWRVATYNIISSQAREIPFIFIDKISVSENDSIKIDYTIAGDRELSTASLHSWWNPYSHISYNGLSYTIGTIASTWQNEDIITFPTDRPVGHESQDAENPATWIPYGLDRNRPVVTIHNHQYYMWYSKTGANFGNDTIIHSRGKTYDVYGEYDIAFPDTPTKSLNSYNGQQSVFSPCIVFDNGVWKMWLTMFDGTTNRIAYSTSADADNWSVPIIINGIGEDCYSPWVVKKNNVYNLWYCKIDGGVSKIFYATSSDGLEFTVKNSGVSVLGDTKNLNTPCVVDNNGYIMYFTKFDTGISKIYSVVSEDGIVWTDEQVEIDEEGSMNPCVIKDIKFGNNVFRMYYNHNDGTTNIIKTKYKDNKQWKHVTLNGMSGLSGDINNVKSNIFGRSGQIIIDLTNSNIVEELRNVSESDNVFFGLNYSNDISVRDYVIRSQWIDYTNAELYDCVIEPSHKYSYNSVIKDFAYLEE